MKNFPHQMSDLFRLTRGLQVFRDLQVQGSDLSSDEVVGASLARAGVYTFRAKGQTVEEALRVEAEKPRSSRGTQTAARDLRRIFFLCGFLEQDGSGDITLSETGKQLVAMYSADQKADLLLLWGRALRGMALEGSGGSVSHPYRVLLSLVDARPGIAKRYLALALEAEDDSSGELQRILELIDRGDWHSTLDAIGATEYSAQNAIKILPAMAEQIGDIVKEGEACYPGSLGSEIGQLTVGEVVGTAARDDHRLPSRRHRSVTAEEIARGITDDSTGSRVHERSFARIQEGVEQRRERTNRHQRLVQDFACLCENAGLSLFEYPFDCLAIGTEGQCILAEMKTLAGGFEDERSQLQRALAQLHYYEFFDLPEEAIGSRQTLRLAVFESEIADEHRRFLEHHGVHVIWHTTGGFSGTSKTLAALRGLGIL
jgi:hypothetical protein